MDFLQDHNEDLRTAMETTIDINAIRAMSCFENRDFEGLKVAMRKMPNSQATGEELGLSISCCWDMEAFDMLATVEALKRVSKRRSDLWSLNAVLQLTQDLTRIHNVDEHALWSEERAAIKNRQVPLLLGQKFAPVQHSVRALNSILLYSQPSFNHQSPPTPQSSNTSLGSPLRSFHSDASSSTETYLLGSLVTMIERYQNAHMLININIAIAIEFLSRSILRHLINESQGNPSYNNQRSLINIEKCSRNLLHIVKWSRTAIESNHEITTTSVVSLGKLFQLRKQYLLTGLSVDIVGDFSTLTCPKLAKSWFTFADQAYAWGRQLFARSLPYVDNEVPSKEIIEISRIISSIRILNDNDSELTASELSLLHSYRTDLSRACSLLARHPTLIEQLLALHPQFDLRRYFLLEQSCRAYFTHLQLSNTSTYGNSNEKKSNNTDDASNVLVTYYVYCVHFLYVILNNYVLYLKHIFLTCQLLHGNVLYHNYSLV
ncbi:unnamed protein product [Rotaria socialis]|uniref:Uncharacterized protein n=3 Tax=Rotaria socialis TaxID=392032 RepID=A0A817NCG8_9BILA|nr:unnamed protein product [Rotaria socialis]